MSNGENQPVLATERLHKRFSKGGRTIEVLRDLEISLPRGEIVGILGASGAGKSTLLHIVGGLDEPTSGRVLHEGRDIFGLSEYELASFRNRRIGFVFQMHYLLAEFTCLENVMMPGIIAGHDRNDLLGKSKELLVRVGLGERMDHRPGELSGGEQQRAAVARALVNNPSLVLADEPTGNLDALTAGSVRDLFLELNRDLGTTFLVVTHNRDMAAKFHRRFELKNGALHAEV
ncbi:MAG: ABC transporter ATP-binding protein [bacterium]|nr:MAG: ABC transporter ATP-binding protein [bacterium]